MTEAKHSAIRYAIAAIGSGVVWFCVACVLDEGWAIPHDRISAIATFLLCGVISGLFVSYTFRGAFRRLRLPWLFFLPLVTIPVGVSAFAALLWSARVLLGYHFSPAPSQGDLPLIL
jgi:hypothetical protein